MVKDRIAKFKQGLNTSNLNWSESFFLVFFLILFGFSCFCFIKNFIEHESIVRIIASLVYGSACLSWAIVYWRKFITENPEKKIDNISPNKTFSQKWWSEDFPATIFIAAILLIPIIIIFLIVSSHPDESTKNYVISDPKFEILEDFSTILIGLCLFFEALSKIVNIKPKLARQFLGLLTPIFGLSGFIIHMIYVANLTEVTQ
ncbi:MAG: hypothetical protein AAGF26_09270 [Cyanobacteria bacterium P01_G01_bin.49]